LDTTLAKGLAVLDWLVRQEGECRVTDVAEAFKIGRSNAHRTLQTLVLCGWVLQDARSSAYRPSLRLFELGMLVHETTDMKELLRPLLAKLAEATGETVHLAVLDAAEIVYLDKFASPLPVIAYSRVGGRAPAYCIATGKALLAALGEDLATLRQRLGRLVTYTPNTITDFARLHAELLRTRTRGYAENREEWRAGVCGLGAPVFNATGLPVAAVGISVPSIRFTRGQAKALSEALVGCARDASTALGYADSATPPGRLATRSRYS